MNAHAKVFGALLVIGAVLGCGDSGGSTSTTGSGGNGSGSSGSTTAGTGGGTGAGTPCEQICDKNVEIDAVLACGYDGTSCVTDCTSAFNDLPAGCEDEAIAYNDCLIAQPPDDFACNGDGTATLSTTACADAFDSLNCCVFACGSGGGGTGGAGTGGGAGGN